jgi:hypothetical protein
VASSTAEPTTTEGEVRQKQLDVLADTMLKTATLTDAIAIEIEAGVPASIACQEAYSKLAAVYWAAAIRFEEANLHSAGRYGLSPPIVGRFTNTAERMN